MDALNNEQLCTEQSTQGDARTYRMPPSITTTGRCARLWVQQAGTGFLRERVLVEPVPHCNTSYWYAPDFRVGGAAATMPPPVDPDRPSRPDPPPRTLPNG